MFCAESAVSSVANLVDISGYLSKLINGWVDLPTYITDAIGSFIPKLIVVFKEKPNELISLIKNIDAIFQNHEPYVAMGHLKSQDSYYIDAWNEKHPGKKISLVPLMENADYVRVSFDGFNDLGLYMGDKSKGERVVSVDGHRGSESEVTECEQGFAVGYYSYVSGYTENMELFFHTDQEFTLTMKQYSIKPRHNVEYTMYYQFFALDEHKTVKLELKHMKTSTYFDSKRYTVQSGTDTAETMMKHRFGDQDTELDSVFLTPDLVTLEVGESSVIQCTTNIGRCIGVKWSSSDTDVVAVNEYGKLTAFKQGSATITAAIGDVSGTATVHVTPAVVTFDGRGGTPEQTTAEADEYGHVQIPADPVRDGYVFGGWYSEEKGGFRIDGHTVFTKGTTVYAHWYYNGVTGLTLDREEATVFTGDRVELTATVTTAYAPVETDVVWSSADPSVATVDGGVVTAVSQGTTTITAKSGTSDHSASCEITVKDRALVTFDPNGGTLLFQKLRADGNGKILFLPTPQNIGYRFLGWYTDAAAGDPIDRDHIFGQDQTIYAHWEAICPEIIHLSRGTVTQAPGITFVLMYSVTPSDSIDDTVVWSSSDEGVATVDQKGMVTAVSAGSARITAVSATGTASQHCDVIVAEGVKKYTVTFDGNGGITRTASIETEYTGKLPFLPDVLRFGYTFQGWYTDAGDRVDGDTVFKSDTTLYAHWEPIPIERIILNTYEVKLFVDGSSQMIEAVPLPLFALRQAIEWRSQDPSVATVSGGIVKPVGIGTTVVTASIGDIEAECTIIVRESPVPIIPDMTKEETSEQIADPKKVVEEISVIREESKIPSLDVTLSTEVDFILPEPKILWSIYGSEGELKVNSPVGHAYFDESSLLNLSVVWNNPVLRIRTADVESDLNTVAAVDFSVISGGRTANMRFQNCVELGIAYDLNPDDLDKYAVYYIPVSGDPVRMEIQGYEDGQVYFFTYHFSTYQLVYEGEEPKEANYFAIIIAMILAAVTVAVTAVQIRYRY